MYRSEGCRRWDRTEKKDDGVVTPSFGSDGWWVKGVTSTQCTLVWDTSTTVPYTLTTLVVLLFVF